MHGNSSSLKEDYLPGGKIINSLTLYARWSIYDSAGKLALGNIQFVKSEQQFDESVFVIRIVSQELDTIHVIHFFVLGLFRFKSEIIQSGLALKDLEDMLITITRKK